MNLFNQVVEGFKKNKKVRESGGYVNIPFLNFPRISRAIPGVQKARYYGVTGSSKAGKTQLCDALFLQEPINFIMSFIKKGEEPPIKIKIDYFSLEISREMKIATLISNFLYNLHGISVDPENLNSQYREYILEDDVLEKIEELEKDFEIILEYVEFIDNIRNPWGIYKHMVEQFEAEGKYEYEYQKFRQPDGSYKTNKVIKRYIPDNEDVHRIVIIDHISLFTVEKQSGTLHATMAKWSSTYALSLRDRYKCTVVNVQQQASESEKAQFTFKGDMVIEKLKPTPDGLGNNKEIQRDYDILFGIFPPDKYKIPEYKGYDISKSSLGLRDNYREFLILINRRGSANRNTDLFFDGRINMFKELPPYNDPKYHKYVIPKIKKLRQNLKK